MMICSKPGKGEIQRNHFKTPYLLQKIHSMKQKYFINLKAFWEELNSLRLIYKCSCVVKYNYDLIKTVKTYKD
ncbi:hypothetical protein CR513_48250, partial [Mucuna pruriens]